MKNIRDFIILHYLTKKDNSKFWIDLQSQPIPDSLQEKIEKFKYNLPIEEDFRDTSKYSLFGANHYIHILYGLDLLDVDSINNEYKMFHYDVQNLAVQALSDTKTFDSVTPMMTHKRFLQVIKSQR